MKRTILKIVLILLSILLIAEIGAIGLLHFGILEMPGTPEVPTEPAQTEGTLPTETAAPTTEPAAEPTVAPTTEPTAPPTTAPATEPATEPTAAPTEAPTEPGPEHFTLTFVGDCTLGSDTTHYNVKYSLIWTVGEDYDYPFRNVRQYFENDDLTMINLEGVFTDEGYPVGGMFSFRGPPAYTNILTGSSVEAVTLANNHAMDYGQKGYESTKSLLDASGIHYVERDGSKLFTTESGLTVGLYAALYLVDEWDMKEEIQQLRDDGAEIVICAMHWGVEGSYRPQGQHETWARMAIDAGADIVYGHHPHVLQRIEEYNGGIIYYSLGNFCFGGNNYPQDLDTAILQQEVIRDLDGSISLGELTIIPASCSSLPVQNNFQPTPYEEGTKEYDRAMSKLDGTFKGYDLTVDYGE